MKNSYLLAIVFCTILPLSLSAKAEEDLAGAQKFYEAFLQAGYNYDQALLGMFGDNVISHITVFAADGKTIDKTLVADEVRDAIKGYLANGAANNIKLVYENVSYATVPAGVKVTAHIKYHNLCYTDETYSALLARNEKAEYRIKEEFLKIPEKSLCKVE